MKSVSFSFAREGFIALSLESLTPFLNSDNKFELGIVLNSDEFQNFDTTEGMLLNRYLDV